MKILILRPEGKKRKAKKKGKNWSPEKRPLYEAAAFPINGMDNI